VTNSAFDGPTLCCHPTGPPLPIRLPQPTAPFLSWTTVPNPALGAPNAFIVSSNCPDMTSLPTGDQSLSRHPRHGSIRLKRQCKLICVLANRLQDATTYFRNGRFDEFYIRTASRDSYAEVDHRLASQSAVANSDRYRLVSLFRLVVLQRVADEAEISPLLGRQVLQNTQVTVKPRQRNVWLLTPASKRSSCCLLRTQNRAHSSQETYPNSPSQ